LVAFSMVNFVLPLCRMESGVAERTQLLSKSWGQHSTAQHETAQPDAEHKQDREEHRLTEFARMFGVKSCQQCLNESTVP
jgi:hypothetical protein